jgi:hypothetical protein
MSDQPEREPVTSTPDASIRLEPEQALQSLEYAIRALSENAAFAREMCNRARADNDMETAAEFDSEAAEAERHVAALSRLAGSLRLAKDLTKPRKHRAA